MLYEVITRRCIEAIQAKLGPIDSRKVLCENAARLYGFDSAALAPLVARIGPEKQLFHSYNFV